MKDVETYNGELAAIERVRSSRNGNPRFRVRITGAPVCYTAPDDMLGYSIQDLREGEAVAARIGWHYGTVTLASIERAK